MHPNKAGLDASKLFISPRKTAKENSIFTTVWQSYSFCTILASASLHTNKKATTKKRYDISFHLSEKPRLTGTMMALFFNIMIRNM